MTSRVLPGLGIRGFWGLGFDGWNTENDNNLLMLSVLTQARVISRLTAVPASPADGDIYILTAAPHVNEIAIRDNGAWVYLVPQSGWLFRVVSESKNYRFVGTTWTLENNSTKYNVAGFFNIAPVASETILRHIFTENVTFDDEFLNSKGVVLANPSAPFVISVLKNGSLVGSITISPTGVFTYVTTGTTLSFTPGDFIEWVAPATADVTIANGAITLIGSRS